MGAASRQRPCYHRKSLLTRARAHAGHFLSSQQALTRRLTVMSQHVHKDIGDRGPAVLKAVVRGRCYRDTLNDNSVIGGVLVTPRTLQASHIPWQSRVTG